MEREFITKAICLNSVDYKEKDKQLTLFSLENGLMSAVLKGCKTAKAKLKLLANADLLSQKIKVSELNLDLDNFLNFKSHLDLEGMGLKKGFVNIHTLRIAPYSM